MEIFEHYKQKNENENMHTYCNPLLLDYPIKNFWANMVCLDKLCHQLG